MPVVVVEATRRLVREQQPTKWYAYVLPGYSQHHQRIFSISSRTDYAYFLVTAHTWCYLTARSVSCLNEIVGRDLKDEKKLATYLDDLDNVMLPQCVTLDDDFRFYLRPQDRDGWLMGRDRNVESLQRLCHRPTVTAEGGDVTITYNKMTFHGNVLRRTVHAKAGKWLELTGIESAEIRSNGTFSFPLVR